jgi:hypothetical protein
MTAAGVPGQCMYCRCTEDRPCTLPNGDTCGWLNNNRTVCNAPRCIAQNHIDIEKGVAREWRGYLQQKRAQSFQRRQRRKKKKGGKAA